MEFKITPCFVCGENSYPDDNSTPHICYSCQWNQINERDATTSTKCQSCNVPMLSLHGAVLCYDCELKTRIHEILPGVFISDSFISRQYEFLKSLGIKQILTVAKELKKHEHPDFESMHISIDDCPTENIRQYFEQTHEFISKAPTLIHCFAGISRSATIVISYVMKAKQLCAVDATRHCKKIRAVINPNVGFATQLLAYANELNLRKLSTAVLAEEISEEIFAMDEVLDWMNSSMIFEKPSAPPSEDDVPMDTSADNFIVLQSPNEFIETAKK